VLGDRPEGSVLTDAGELEGVVRGEQAHLDVPAQNEGFVGLSAQARARGDPVTVQR